MNRSESLFFCETGSHHVGPGYLKLMITVPGGQWDWKCIPLHPAKRRNFDRHNGKHYEVLLKIKNKSLAWWITCIIPALGNLRQEDPKFERSLAYTVRFNNNNNNKKAIMWPNNPATSVKEMKPICPSNIYTSLITSPAIHKSQHIVTN